ncbi:UDP-glucose 4-epimerase GalE, partial [Enterobacter cloacae]|nr:UDP-glucose 4-epimerase GalE [Enterobacter cloacae]
YPLEYYHNNIVSVLSLIKTMVSHGVHNLIFSSSATVYGVPESIPLIESCRTGGTTNPYGSSKFFIEQILNDVSHANSNLNIMLLRYFNPVGAHHSGSLGEAPNGTPNNLFPYITQVAVGKLDKVYIYGDNYDTPDGTGVRDYIHVMDLAEGHLAALNAQKDHPGLKVYNLGTGKGYSVKEIVTAFKKITGVDIPYQITERRLGDIAECWSDPTLASHELGWNAKRGLDEMIADAWRWQQKNPAGYK